MERSCLRMEKTIMANEDNDLKYLSEEMKEQLKKKKKQQENGEITESVEEQPLQYFTE